MNDKTSELLATLKAEVDSLTSTDNWKAWLTTAATFRKYSFRNQLLILSQRPDATQVAGYKAWQKLGRQVRQGETAISILAPIIKKVRDEKTGVEDKKLVGWRGTSVFDISQTDGPPLPEAPAHQPAGPVLVTDEDLYARFEKVAADEGVTITTQASDRSARGWYSPAEKAITIVDGYPLASRTRTLLHELGHHFTDDLAELGRAEKELIAESAAFIVGNLVGLDTTEYSAFYTAGWAGGDSKEIEKVAKRVLATVDHLVVALGLEESK